MSGHDAELESLRAGVSCAVLLERLPPPWQLDQRESTRRCLKYRRGAGEVLIVNHDGRGWWDPMSRAKGDVFTLAQHLDPGLNFGQVRRLLRPFVGLSPAYPALPRRRERQAPPVPVAQRWARRAPVRSGSPAWDYLTRTRALPEAVVLAAIQAGVLREGPHASAWFAHLDHAGRLSGIEMRGPAWRGFSPNGTKTLFRLPGGVPASTGAGRPTRLAVTEAPIEAMSLAVLEGLRAGHALPGRRRRHRAGDGRCPAAAAGRAGGRPRSRPGRGHQRRCRRRALRRAAGRDGGRRRRALGAAAAARRRERLQRRAQDGEGSMIPQQQHAWLRLGSGRRLDVLNPDPQGGWTDADLAVGLSRTYRWGSTSRWELPLSVAQHSLTVLAIREQQAWRTLSPAHALRELLHDGDEFLIGGWDCPAPLKPHLGEPYARLVGRLRAAIAARYGLPAWSADDYTLHKQADRLAAASEALARRRLHAPGDPRRPADRARAP